SFNDTVGHLRQQIFERRRGALHPHSESWGLSRRFFGKLDDAPVTPERATIPLLVQTPVAALFHSHTAGLLSTDLVMMLFGGMASATPRSC
ncbi:MAG: hypothetical protein ACUVSU_09815, partial [Aggregatilineaceae bacterium]